jgi:hypothetical protein
MSAKWFCKIMGDEQGPLTAAQLQEIARSGRLGIDDLVRNDSQSIWVRAENVAGLFDQPTQSIEVQQTVPGVDDAEFRATWEPTVAMNAANGTKCSIELNATTVSSCNNTSTATGGTTNQQPRNPATRLSSVMVPRRTLKMNVSSHNEPELRTSANRTTRAMNFDSMADTLACAEAARPEEQQKTVQSLPQVPPTEEQGADHQSADERAEIVERFFEVWRRDAGRAAGAVALAEQH